MSSLVSNRCLLPPALADQAVPRYGLAFAVLLLLNATLFVRPAEMFPFMLGWQIYLALILLCLAFSFPILFEQLQPATLERQPISVCVLMLWLANFLSHMAHAHVMEAFDLGWDFAKVFLYFLLFVGLVTTPQRLRLFLFCLMLFTTVLAALAVLQYHGHITLVNLDPIKEGWDNAQRPGERAFVTRLVGTGLFQDPNDLCFPLIVAILLGLYWITDSSLGAARFALAGPLLLLCYALSLTQSRGGMLAFMFALVVLLYSHFGGKLALGLAATVLPALLLVFGGRQTSFETSSGTAQDRVQLWSDALDAFRSAPLFGVGRDEFGKMAGLVAHNSFLHAFADLGFFGGMFYAGAFATAASSLYLLGKQRALIIDPELRRLQPYLLAVVAGSIGSMMTLTLCYIIPVYTILGIAVVYTSMTRTLAPLPLPRCDVRLVLHYVRVGVIVLVSMYLFVRFARV